MPTSPLRYPLWTGPGSPGPLHPREVGSCLPSFCWPDAVRSSGPTLAWLELWSVFFLPSMPSHFPPGSSGHPVILTVMFHVSWPWLPTPQRPLTPLRCEVKASHGCGSLSELVLWRISSRYLPWSWTQPRLEIVIKMSGPPITEDSSMSSSYAERLKAKVNPMPQQKGRRDHRSADQKSMEGVIRTIVE